MDRFVTRYFNKWSGKPNSSYNHYSGDDSYHSYAPKNPRRKEVDVKAEKNKQYCHVI
ncbi:MAG: hypothetical protein QXT57_00035 [Thermosphaera sp.]